MCCGSWWQFRGQLCLPAYSSPSALPPSNNRASGRPQQAEVDLLLGWSCGSPGTRVTRGHLLVWETLAGERTARGKTQRALLPRTCPRGLCSRCEGQAVGSVVGGRGGLLSGAAVQGTALPRGGRGRRVPAGMAPGKQRLGLQSHLVLTSVQHSPASRSPGARF